MRKVKILLLGLRRLIEIFVLVSFPKTRRLRLFPPLS